MDKKNQGFLPRDQLELKLVLMKSKCVKISHFKCVYFGQPVCENSIFQTTHVHNGQLQSKQFMCAPSIASEL